MKLRNLNLKAASYDTREEVFEGRNHLVVPVIALVEGVIQAMNAPTPELVTAAEYTRPGVVGGFNGRPLYEGHPVVNGEPVSGNSPALLDAKSIGRVFNAFIKSGKLAMEAWIDIEKATEVAPDILTRAQAGDPIEISVGVFCETDEEETGEYNGKKYAGAWRDIVPDHLALLPAEDTGACSVEMGCGVRAAKGVGAVEKTKDPKTTSMLARFMSMFRGSQSPENMSDNDVRRELADELRKKDPRAMYPDAVYASAATPYVVYCVYEGNDLLYFRRDYSIAADGKVTFGDATEVEPVLSYETVSEVTAASADNKDTVKGATCTCHNNGARSAIDMNKEQIAKFLETATDEQVKALSAVVETPAAPVVETKKDIEDPATVVAEVKVEVPAVAAAAATKTPTFEEVLATAEPSVRDAIAEGQRVGAAKRADTIKALKDTGRCDMSDKELGAKSQSELDQLVKLAGAPAVDFSAAGASRSQEKVQEIPAAPDMTAAVRAARGTK